VANILKIASLQIFVMRKILLIFSLHFVLGVIFWGCCTNPDEIKIIGGSQSFLSHDNIYGNPSDTIRGDFIIINFFETKIAHNNFNFGGGFNSLYAMQPCENVFVNKIENIEWYFDIPLVLNNETIPANTNLKTYNETKDLIEQGQYEYEYFTSFTIGNLEIPVGYATIRLVLETDDDLIIENEFEVYMNIE